ncbi:MAG: hypothetical protein V4610_15610 [Pseudomonadota bacterium]
MLVPFVALGLIAVTSPIRATPSTPGECVWKSLPQASRKAALDAGLAQGPLALIAQVKPEVDAVEPACGMNADNEAAFHRAESGFMLQLLAETWLQQELKLTPERLDAAWRKLSPGARQNARLWAIYMSPDSKEFGQVYTEFAKLLVVGGEALPAHARPKIVTYLQGRSLRTVYEPEI